MSVEFDIPSKCSKLVTKTSLDKCNWSLIDSRTRLQVLPKMEQRVNDREEHRMVERDKACEFIGMITLELSWSLENDTCLATTKNTVRIIKYQKG